MPRVHECNERGCRRIVPLKQRYCEEHSKLHQPFQNVTKRERRHYYREYNANNRDQQANNFYHSKQWTAVRNYVTHRDMYTSAVSGRVLSDHDVIVDHVVRRDLVGDPLDVNNLWLLSRSEHAIKTQLEESIMKQPHGRSKLRRISREWWVKTISRLEDSKRLNQSHRDNT